MKITIPQKYIDDGLITAKEHPSEPYVIYNYTQKCQFAGAWDEVTMMCRGLILHKDTGEIIARPFPKFFNYEEHVAKGLPIPNERPKVYEKVDGSLGILYFGTDGKPWIATRGSFTSEQAIWATDYIRKNNWTDNGRDKNITDLYEIIYPENRIVVDYKDLELLLPLASVNIETGKSVGSSWVRKENYDSLSPEELKAINEKNKEGFILHYENTDLRLKVKFEDYVKLHKVITGLSNRGIWEMLKDGKTHEEMSASVPDEMFAWLEEVANGLEMEYYAIEQEAIGQMKLIDKNQPRNVLGKTISQMKNPSILFNMLDGKDYSQIIWKQIKPKGQKMFKTEI